MKAETGARLMAACILPPAAILPGDPDSDDIRWHRYLPERGVVQIGRDARRTMPVTEYIDRAGSARVLRYPWAWVYVAGWGETT